MAAVRGVAGARISRPALLREDELRLDAAEEEIGVELLIGVTGIAVGELRPVGQVKLNGEIWNAHCEDGCDAGATVVVLAIDGLTLSVASV